MDASELTKLGARCVAMAREAPEDPYAGLAPETLLFRGPAPDFDLDDGSEADPDALRAAALAVENAARAIDRVTTSEGGPATHPRPTLSVAPSQRLAGRSGGVGGGWWKERGCQSVAIKGV